MHLSLKYLIVGLTPLWLVACQSPGVIQTGPNAYLLTRTSAGGVFANQTKLKYDTIREANAFAATKGKIAEGIVGTAVPPQPGRMPSFEYQFRLADQNSSGNSRKVISSEAIHIESVE